MIGPGKLLYPHRQGVEVWRQLAALGLAVYPTAIALRVLYRLLERAGASFAARVNHLIPVFAAILGAATLDERPGLQVFRDLL